MAEFTSVYGKTFRDGKTYQDWCTPEANVSHTMGFRLSESNWVMCIKFELPTASKTVTMNFCNAQQQDRVPTLRYKFTTSEEEALQNATSETEGDGAFTLASAARYGRTEVTLNAVLSAGTHYLYIWTDDSSVLYNWNVTRWYDNVDGYGFSASYEELGGLVFLDDGESLEPYECFIDNSTGWDRCVPHIDNGTDWDICS